jgi:hypothetical protein
MIDYAEHEEMTDEEVYQMLKENCNPNYMDADEWKKLRLIQLKKDGKSWSKK